MTFLVRDARRFEVDVRVLRRDSSETSVAYLQALTFGESCQSGVPSLCETQLEGASRMQNGFLVLVLINGNLLL